jgi:membrane-anchored protein YejM (alkaline phosphatase superfamily)
VDSVNHPTAMYQINCGNRFGGDPAIGAWVNYGLGTVNQDLPGFIVLPEISYPQGGSANWSNGYLPADFQGTPLRPKGSPILDLQPPKEITPEHQRANLDLLAQLNQRHAADHPWHGDLKARMNNYELAFRMQMQVPEVLDLSNEDETTKAMYGIGNDPTDAFGRKCLLARKLVEKGVRFVQLYAGTWDSHDYIERAHGNLIRQVDQPIASLIKDLRQRGLLDDTLIVWCGEFGRTPDNGVRGGTAYGRDHNPKAMTLWFAGGGVKAGHTIGATDDRGMEAVECVRHVRDVHVTLLRLLGLDDNKLTFYHAGRFKQLSQFGGQVIEELIA